MSFSFCLGVFQKVITFDAKLLMGCDPFWSSVKKNHIRTEQYTCRRKEITVDVAIGQKPEKLNFMKAERPFVAAVM